MIHVLPVLTGLLLLSSSSFSLVVDTEADLDADLAFCDNGDDGCITGYTSLLQTSIHLSGHRSHRRGKHHHHWATDVTANGVDTKPSLLTGSTSAGSWTAGGRERLGLGTLWIVGGVLLFIAMAYTLIIRPRTRAGPRDFMVPDHAVTDQDEVHPRMRDALGEDAYSLAISLVVRDVQSLALGEPKPGLKISRIAFAIGLILMTVGFQIGTVLCTKQFVTPNQVADIRDAYDKFEDVMYNGHTYLNAFGKHRGIEGFFNASAFADLSDDDRSNACNIPFSQLSFLFLILLVWSITCMSNLRQNIEMFLTLIVCTETKDSMQDSMMHWEAHEMQFNEEKDSQNSTQSKDVMKSMISTATGTQHAIPMMVIVGLTSRIKVFLTICIFVPEFLTTSYILWLGSRWLTATNDFGDIVCNAVALEFILQLKYLTFVALASERNKRDLSFTAVVPPWKAESAGFFSYFNSVVWIVCALVWVTLYIFYFQHVLPDYKWDVHQVCNDYLANILKQSGGGD